MALFRKKPSDGDGDDGKKPEFTPQPEAARKWFEHAKTSADTYNFEYALTCFASGLALDPDSMSAHEAMFAVAVRYANNGGKPAASKDLKKFDDGTPIGRFVAAEFEWMKDLQNYKAAVKVLEASVKAGQLEFGSWIAPRVLGLLRGQKKHTKSSLVKAMELFRDVEAWNESLAVGEMAVQLDPTDGELANEIKNLSAQRAMTQGGYEQQAGQEGGFRAFIKDADKQKELVEEESIAGGASVEERNLARAQEAWESDRTPDALNRYAQLLKRQGTPESEARAVELYEQGFQLIGEYRFKMAAGDIRISQAERRTRNAERALEGGATDGGQAAYDEARHAELELKSGEYAERVEKYPTDRFRRYDLGVVQFELGEPGDAMAQFQAAKDEPKLRVRAGHMLGRCFLADAWYGEAIAEFRDALGAADGTDAEGEMEIRYDLMLALIAGARDESSLELAREAKGICSDIARKNITYRDIRNKRKEVDELIKELS